VGRSEIAQFASCCDSNSVFFRFFSGVTTGAGDPTRAAACAERMSHQCACGRRPGPRIAPCAWAWARSEGPPSPRRQLRGEPVRTRTQGSM